MAGENEIVIPISADITKLIEQINKLTGDVEELKSAGQEAGNDIKKAFVGAEISVDNTTKAYQELEKEINDVKNAMKGQRDPKVIANQKQYISELQKEQTELRNTGKAFVTLRTQIKVVRDEMEFLIANGQQGTQRFRELSVQLGTLSDRRKDIQELGNVIGSDTRKFDTFAQAVGGVAAAFSVYQGVMALVGSENKDFQKTMTKVMGAMAVANGVQQIANMLQRESAVMVAFNELKTKLLTKATIIQTGATEGATIAQRALNTAIKSNPIGLLVTVLAAAAVALFAYAKKTENARKEQEKLAKESNSLYQVQKKAAEVYGEQVGEIEAYRVRLIKAKDNKIEFSKIVTEYNENVGKKYNASLKTQQNTLEDIAKALDKAKEAVIAKAMAEASSEQIKKLGEQLFLQKELQKSLDIGSRANINYLKSLKDTDATERIKQEEDAIQARKDNITEIENEIVALSNQISEYEQLFSKKEKNKKSAEALRNEEVRLYTDMKMGAISTSKEVSELIKRYRELFLEFDAAKRNKTDMPFGEELPETLDKVSVSIADVAKKYGIALKYISENTEELNEEQKTFWEQNGEAINKWVGVATEAIGIVFAFMQQNSDAELQTISDNFDKQSEKYKTMLDKNLISQEQYDAKVSQLEKEKAAKEKKIKHDAFEQERTAKIINATISGLVGALAQYEAGPAGAILSALVGTLTIANVALIASEKNPYRKGTAQILGGRSHEQGGVSLGSFGEAEQGEFLGILSKRQTATYGNGLMNLFEGLNKNNKDKVLTGLTDIASNVGFSDTNTNLSVSLNEVREIKSIEKMMKSGNTSVTYHNGYREEKSKGLIRRVYV